MHRDHRRRFLELLRAQRAAAVIPSAAHKVRNHDAEYRYRPDSDFWWLTGFDEPDACLVLLPGLADGEAPRSVLFLREKDREREIWTGRRLGVAAAPDSLGVDEARPIETLWAELPKLLANHARIVYRTGIDPVRDARLLETTTRLRWSARGNVAPPAELVDVAPTLHELRLFKSPDELERMRRAARITREAHLECMKRAKPGVNEAELDAVLEYTFRKSGGTGAAYTPIVAGGANACYLHYIENDQPLVDGDLLLIDAGAEFDWYACDVTRTFPVNGRFSPDQRAVYELVLEAQLAAIAHVRPGVRFTDVHDRAVEVLVRGLVRLGVLKGSVETELASEAYKRFYMHRTSHWLGLDVHDCGAYSKDGASRPLEPGMVLTIEPGLYFAADDDTIDARWRGIGVRIEDDVLVTATGSESLTHGIPKGVDEVEAACQGRVLEKAAR